jgi:uncharacterized protein DUF6852/uncharacterized protein DUF5606
MEFKDIAAVSGKGGLFKILKPTKSGVILESLDDKKARLVATVHNKISVLEEISVYTHSTEGTTPLKEVFYTIHAEFGNDTGLDRSSDADELKSFFGHILSDYDEDRVYVSDIKKMVTWYNVLVKEAPELLKRPAKKKDDTPNKGK